MMFARPNVYPRSAASRNSHITFDAALASSVTEAGSVTSIAKYDLPPLPMPLTSIVFHVPPGAASTMRGVALT